MRCRDLTRFSSLEPDQSPPHSRGDNVQSGASRARNHKKIHAARVRCACSTSKWAESGNHRKFQTIPVLKAKETTGRHAPALRPDGTARRDGHTGSPCRIEVARTSGRLPPLRPRHGTNCATSTEQAGLQILKGIAVKAAAQDDDQLTARRQLSGMLTKQFAKKTLTVVALHRIAHTTAGNHPQTGSARRIGHAALKNKRSAVDTMTHAADSLKFAWTAQTH